MRSQEASRTAEFMAVFRASEHAKAPTSRAFADPLAAALLPGELRLAARLFSMRPVAALLNAYIDRRWPGARTSGIARTKLIDDWIGQAACGIDQVVLLGAGRAWRLDALAAARIFEVDHPNAATVKQARLRSAHADLGKVTFVKVDFEIDDFDRLLRAARFDAARPAIVVWEGVSQYLTGEAVCGVLRCAGGVVVGRRQSHRQGGWIGRTLAVRPAAGGIAWVPARARTFAAERSRRRRISRKSDGSGEPSHAGVQLLSYRAGGSAGCLG